ncbi:MAG: hypothetical protein UY24_C0015G0018 [Parcubacteria group bacterium GW2011_GWA1_48_11b]|nr:MAG: hypothetical protein UY24_C0015G0018 [Parcubacteria group bacterium GW2011_GWA1_48_11b]
MKRGQTLFEVILALAIFSLIATTLVSMAAGGARGLVGGGEITQADSLADEGIEAVRGVRDRAWNGLPSGASQVVFNAGRWELNGIGVPEVMGKFSRLISLDEVCRTSAGALTSCPGDYEDIYVKKVASRVEWQNQFGLPNVAERTTYLANWDSRDWVEDSVADFTDGDFADTALHPSFGDGDGSVTLAPIPVPPKSMIVYAKSSGDPKPYFRLWDGTSWGDEQEAPPVGAPGVGIRYMVLKFARTRDEAILGTMDSSGRIRVQTWDGSVWSSPIFLASASGERGFDIEYETTSDRAVVVYNNPSMLTPVSYRIWDGSAWVSQESISTVLGGGISWVELTANPLSGSNEIAMMLIDSRVDVYGMVWTGSVWSNMGSSAVWDANASNATTKIFDIAYEQTTGRAMFMWGRAATGQLYYRVWDGGALTAPTLLSISAMNGRSRWLRLASDFAAGSNKIMMGVQGGTGDLNTRLWSGTAWDTVAQHPEHDNSVEEDQSRSFDIVFETHPSKVGQAILAWGNGSTVSRKYWDDLTSTWSVPTTSGDDTSFVTLAANSINGDVFLGIYQDSTSATDDILEEHLTGGSSLWSFDATLWGGPTLSGAALERIVIASGKFSTSQTYQFSGTYISNAFDAEATRAFNGIQWKESKTNPACGACTVRLQIQTSADGLSWPPTWSGPLGNNGDEIDFFIIPTGTLIHTDHNGDRWVRYRATLEGDGSETPILEEIRINYR